MKIRLRTRRNIHEDIGLDHFNRKKQSDKTQYTMVTVIIVVLSVLILSFLGLVVYLSIRDAKNEVDDIRKFEDMGKKS